MFLNATNSSTLDDKVVYKITIKIVCVILVSLLVCVETHTQHRSQISVNVENQLLTSVKIIIIFYLASFSGL